MGKILDLFKTGNFTINYHDNGRCTVHKGRHSYDEDVKEVGSFEGNSDGYIPDEVAVLVKALGGKVNSI